MSAVRKESLANPSFSTRTLEMGNHILLTDEDSESLGLDIATSYRTPGSIKKYFNYTNIDLLLQHRNGKSERVDRATSSFSTSNALHIDSFIIIDSHTVNASEMEYNSEEYKTLDPIKKNDATLRSIFLKACHDEVVKRRNNHINPDIKTFHIASIIAVEDLLYKSDINSSIELDIYYRPLDILISRQEYSHTSVHPDNESLLQDLTGLYRGEERDTMTSAIDIVDNESHSKVYYTFYLGRLTKIPSRRSETRRSGVYVSIFNALLDTNGNPVKDKHRLPLFTKDINYHKLEDIADDIGIFTSREEALAKGNHSVSYYEDFEKTVNHYKEEVIICKTNLKEKHEEEIDKMKLEHSVKIADLKSKILVLKTDEVATKQEHERKMYKIKEDAAEAAREHQTVVHHRSFWTDSWKSIAAIVTATVTLIGVVIKVFF